MKMKICIMMGSWSLKLKSTLAVDKGQKKFESWTGQWFIQEAMHQGKHNNNFCDPHSMTTNLLFF